MVRVLAIPHNLRDYSSLSIQQAVWHRSERQQFLCPLLSRPIVVLSVRALLEASCRGSTGRHARDSLPALLSGPILAPRDDASLCATALPPFLSAHSTTRESSHLGSGFDSECCPRSPPPVRVQVGSSSHIQDMRPIGQTSDGLQRGQQT